MAPKPVRALSGGLTLPAKNAPPTPENVQALHSALTSLIARHPQATDDWTFYEVLDDYLGPWGMNGYPIAYGKFYCVAFNSNEKLMANPATHDWVARTTVRLQESLRDYIVQRFKQGTLGKMTEAELRKAAFDSHPAAYTDGGLATVTLAAPELIEVIASIPGKEFSPFSQNFKSSVNQVFATLELVAPRTAGMGLAALAGPAHTGLLSRAIQKDMLEMAREQSMGLKLKELQKHIQSGRLDDIATLNGITDRLNATQYPDPGLSALARAVIRTADDRKHYVAQTYRKFLQQRPDLRGRFDKAQPGWNRW
ncbi:MAG TPA: hypothetical protein VI431_13260 [Candidatus Acidoferrum sp.]